MATHLHDRLIGSVVGKLPRIPSLPCGSKRGVRWFKSVEEDRLCINVYEYSRAEGEICYFDHRFIATPSHIKSLL